MFFIYLFLISFKNTYLIVERGFKDKINFRQRRVLFLLISVILNLSAYGFSLKHFVCRVKKTAFFNTAVLLVVLWDDRLVICLTKSEFNVFFFVAGTKIQN